MPSKKVSKKRSRSSRKTAPSKKITTAPIVELPINETSTIKKSTFEEKEETLAVLETPIQNEMPLPPENTEVAGVEHEQLPEPDPEDPRDSVTEVFKGTMSMFSHMQCPRVIVQLGTVYGLCATYLYMPLAGGGCDLRVAYGNKACLDGIDAIQPFVESGNIKFALLAEILVQLEREGKKIDMLVVNDISNADPITLSGLEARFSEDVLIIVNNSFSCKPNQEYARSWRRRQLYEMIEMPLVIYRGWDQASEKQIDGVAVVKSPPVGSRVHSARDRIFTTSED